MNRGAVKHPMNRIVEGRLLDFGLAFVLCCGRVEAEEQQSQVREGDFRRIGIRVKWFIVTDNSGNWIQFFQKMK